MDSQPFQRFAGRFELLEPIPSGPGVGGRLGRDRRGGERVQLSFRTLTSEEERRSWWERLDRTRRLLHPSLPELLEGGVQPSEGLDGGPPRAPSAEGRSGDDRLPGSAPPERPSTPFPLLGYAVTSRPQWPSICGQRRPGTIPPRTSAHAARSIDPDRGPPDWTSDCEAILARALEALDALHAAGLVVGAWTPQILLLDRQLESSGSGSGAREPRGAPAEGSAPPHVFLATLPVEPSRSRELLLPRESERFAAPEVARDHRGSEQGDLFGLAMCLVCAAAPDSCEELFLDPAALGSVRGPAVPASLLRELFPEPSARLLEHLLQLDPAERPASAWIARQALAAVRKEASPELVDTLAAPGALPPETSRLHEQEVQLATAEMDEAYHGEEHRGVVVFEGSAGQEPSSLLEDLALRAGVRGFRVYWAVCAECPPAPYAPFAEIVAQAVAQQPGIATAAQGLERGLKPWLPRSTLEALGLAGETGGESVEDPVGPGARIAFLDDVTSFLIEIASRGPTLLLLEGLERARPEDLELLRELSRKIHHLSVGAPFAPRDRASTPRLLVVASRELPEEVETADGRPPDTGGGDATEPAPLWPEPWCLRLPLGDSPGRRKEKAVAARRERGGGAPSPLAALLPIARDLPPIARSALDLCALAGAPLLAQDLRQLVSAGRASPPSDDQWDGAVSRLRAAGVLAARQGAAGRSLHVRRFGLATALRARWTDAGAEDPTPIHRLLQRHFLTKDEDDRGALASQVALQARAAGDRRTFLHHALVAARRCLRARAVGCAGALYEAILSELAGARAAEDGALAMSDGSVESARREALERLSAIYGEGGEENRAIDCLTQLVSAYGEAGERLLLASAYRRMGEHHAKQGETEAALWLLEKSLRAVHGLQGVSAGVAGEPAPTGQEAVASLPSPSGREATHEESLTLLALARVHAARDDLRSAAAALGRAIHLCEELSEGAPDDLCEAHLLMAEVSGKLGNHAQASTHLLRSMALSAGTDLGQRLRVLSAAGSRALERGDYEKARAYLSEGASLAESSRWRLELARFLRSLGTLHHNRSDPERALECFSRSLSLSLEVGDARGTANSYNNLGLVYRLRDELSKASECYRLAIDLFGRIPDESGMAIGMNNLSGILELEGRYDDALDYSLRALERRKRQRSKSGMAFCYYRVGRIFQSKGYLDKALANADRSLELRREIEDRLGQGHSKLLLAELHNAQGRYAEARQLAEEALSNFEDLGNEPGVLDARHRLADALRMLGDLEGSLQMGERVLERARARQEKLLAARALLLLARLAVDSGDAFEAEPLLEEAERTFRAHSRWREVVESLLELSSAQIDLQELSVVQAHLDEAYSILERLGVQDLVPVYFLLRGKLEARLPSSSLDEARRYLERGIVEAQEVGLVDTLWKLHTEIGLLELQRGDAALGRQRLKHAVEILEGMRQALPPPWREGFFTPRARGDARRALLGRPATSEGAPGPELAPGEAPGQEAAVDADPALRETSNLQRTARRLQEVITAIGGQEDLRGVLERVVDAASEQTGAERAFLLLRAEGLGRAAPLVSRGFDPASLKALTEDIAGTFLGGVLQTGRSLLTAYAQEDRKLLSQPGVRDSGLRSILCVPVCFRDEVLGVLYLDHTRRIGAFGRRHLLLAKTFADHAAIAAKNARLLLENRAKQKSLEEANQKLEILNLKLKQVAHKRSAQVTIYRGDLREQQRVLEERYSFQNIVGKSKALERILFLVEKVSRTQLPVLLEGESGTGKELFARTIHYNGLQRKGRFVFQDCGALPEALLESELFGHTRGAFTGAVADKAGLLEIAHEGTLFLDQVTELSPPMQGKLLRFLQEGEVRRLGSDEVRSVEVRVIAATVEDLETLVRAGRFREDLFYRLNGVRIQIPSLRERKEDIPLLAQQFLQELAPAEGACPTFSPEAVRELLRRPWPGNVRELRHLVERSLLFCQGDVLGPDALVFQDEPEPALASKPSALGAPPRGATRSAEDITSNGFMAQAELSAPPRSLRDARDGAEAGYLRQCLLDSQGNVAEAARRCEVSRESLYRLLRKHGIDPRSPGQSRQGGPGS